MASAVAGQLVEEGFHLRPLLTSFKRSLSGLLSGLAGARQRRDLLVHHLPKAGDELAFAQLAVAIHIALAMKLLEKAEVSAIRALPL